MTLIIGGAIVFALMAYADKWIATHRPAEDDQ